MALQDAPPDAINVARAIWEQVRFPIIDTDKERDASIDLAYQLHEYLLSAIPNGAQAVVEAAKNVLYTDEVIDNDYNLFKFLNSISAMRLAEKHIEDIEPPAILDPQRLMMRSGQSLILPQLAFQKFLFLLTFSRNLPIFWFQSLTI